MAVRLFLKGVMKAYKIDQNPNSGLLHFSMNQNHLDILVKKYIARDSDSGLE